MHLLHSLKFSGKKLTVYRGVHVLSVCEREVGMEFVNWRAVQKMKELGDQRSLKEQVVGLKSLRAAQ